MARCLHQRTVGIISSHSKYRIFSDELVASSANVVRQVYVKGDAFGTDQNRNLGLFRA